MGDIADLYGGEGVDTDRKDAATGFEPLPPGWYQVTVEKAEVKDTKSKNGKYLKLGLVIVGEKYNGRVLFPIINLINTNEQAVNIGMAQLAGLGQACGLARVNDTDELLGKIIEVRVKLDKPQEGYEQGNKVTAYRAIGATYDAQPTNVTKTPPTTPKPAPGTSKPAATSGAKRPWEK